MKSFLFCTIAILFSCVSYATLAPISGPSTVCGGSYTTYTNATTGGTWSVTGGTSSTTISTAGVLYAAVSGGSSTMTITITYTVGSESVTQSATINPTPYIWGSPLFCYTMVTDTFNTTVTGGMWTCDSLANDSISATGVLYHAPTWGPPGVDTIRYIMPTGCAAKTVVSVNTSVPMYVPPTFCVGETTSATPIYSGPGYWASSTPTIATITTAGVITGISAGLAFFTFTTYGCTTMYTSTGSAGIVSHVITNVPDTACYGPELSLEICGTSATHNLITAFGDGTSGSASFASSPSVHITHPYTYPGTYTIKQWLYNGTALIDSTRYAYQYNYCRTLPIKLFNDNNGNCLYDAGDWLLHQPFTIGVDSNGIAIDTLPATSGLYYKAYGPAGTVYSFRIVSKPAGVMLTCPSTGVIYDTITAYANTYGAKYFGFTGASSSYFDLYQLITTRCGRHTALLDINVDNFHNTPVSPVMSLDFGSNYGFASSIPPPLSVVGNVATWNLGTTTCMDIAPKMIHIHLERPMPWLTPGDTVQMNYMVGPTTGDSNTANNAVIRIDTVKASFDPNDITVSPSGYIPSTSTLLQYTIRFENTGNDTAHNIFVLDTLSEYLDVRTLHMLGASANMDIFIDKQPGMNVVKFDFPNIMLPDSSHHGLCDGMLVFTIQTKDGLADGTVIPHKVGIYFDDNEPIQTNTARNIVGIPTLGVAEVSKNSKVEVYPNPVNSELTIKTEKGAYSSYTITNSIGQVLMQQPLQGPKTAVDVKALAAGLYYVSLRGDGGNVVRKFVKE